jgi:hypothetical protein
MPKSLPMPSPELNRLRAAAALIPIIESGLAEAKWSAERVALMASFCEWAAELTPSEPEEIKLSESIRDGLQRLKSRLSE